jgi:predicted ATPase
LRFAEEKSLAHWHAMIRVHLGWVLSQRGMSHGVEEIEAGLAEARQIKAGRLEPFQLGLAADAYRLAGRHVEASSSIAKAFDGLAASGGDAAFAAELHRTRASVLLSADARQSDLAEADLRRAFEIARQQEALSLQLRAARDLARRLAERGERQQAVDLLAPIFGAFTEGFDTLDLVESKALLDQLRN